MGQDFDLANANIVGHANSWAARLFKEAQLTIAAALLRPASGNRLAVNHDRLSRIHRFFSNFVKTVKHIFNLF